MDVKAFPALIVGVVVALVLAGAVLPVFAETTSAEDTFTNAGRYYVTTEIEDDVTITMSYDIENNVRSWYIDGVLLEYADYTTSVTGEFVRTPTVAGTDNYVFRTDGRYRGLNSSTGGADYSLTVTKDSITNGSSVGNAPLFIASTEETKNVMRNSPDNPGYVNGDTQIIACGYSECAITDNVPVSVVMSFTGSVNDGVTVTIYNRDYQFTVSNVTVNANAVNGYENLYDFRNVTFDVTYNDGTNDYVTPCTYSMVVLPSEVTAEKSVHPDGALSALLNLLPLLAVAGLVVGAVAWFISRKA